MPILKRVNYSLKEVCTKFRVGIYNSHYEAHDCSLMEMEGPILSLSAGFKGCALIKQGNTWFTAHEIRALRDSSLYVLDSLMSIFLDWGVHRK